jgi:hypothetical protein
MQAMSHCGAPLAAERDDEAQQIGDERLRFHSKGIVATFWLM